MDMRGPYIWGDIIINYEDAFYDDYNTGNARSIDMGSYDDTDTHVLAEVAIENLETGDISTSFVGLDKIVRKNKLTFTSDSLGSRFSLQWVMGGGSPGTFPEKTAATDLRNVWSSHVEVPKASETIWL